MNDIEFKYNQYKVIIQEYYFYFEDEFRGLNIGIEFDDLEKGKDPDGKDRFLFWKGSSDFIEITIENGFLRFATCIYELDFSFCLYGSFMNEFIIRELGIMADYYLRKINDEYYGGKDDRIL